MNTPTTDKTVCQSDKRAKTRSAPERVGAAFVLDGRFSCAFVPSSDKWLLRIAIHAQWNCVSRLHACQCRDVRFGLRFLPLSLPERVSRFGCSGRSNDQTDRLDSANCGRTKREIECPFRRHLKLFIAWSDFTLNQALSRRFCILPAPTNATMPTTNPAIATSQLKMNGV